MIFGCYFTRYKQLEFWEEMEIRIHVRQYTECFLPTLVPAVGGIAVDIMVVYVDTFVRISFPVLGGTDVPESLHFRLGSVDTLWRFTLSKEKKILCLDKKIW